MDEITDIWHGQFFWKNTNESCKGPPMPGIKPKSALLHQIKSENVVLVAEKYVKEQLGRSKQVLGLKVEGRTSYWNECLLALSWCLFWLLRKQASVLELRKRVSIKKSNI